MLREKRAGVGARWAARVAGVRDELGEVDVRVVELARALGGEPRAVERVEALRRLRERCLIRLQRLCRPLELEQQVAELLVRGDHVAGLDVVLARRGLAGRRAAQ